MASKQKRPRKPDFSNEELEVLITLYVHNNEYLNAKFSNTVTQKGKNEIVADITDKVNSVGKNNRTIDSIREKWQNIKAKVKSKAGDAIRAKKKEVRRTGGGEQPEDVDLETVLTELEIMVYSIIPQETKEGKYNKTF